MSDKLHFWKTCFLQSGPKESTWPAWLCPLCAIHITTTFPDASCNDFGTLSFLEKELMFVGTEHKLGCNIAS